jgi:hypothetical protein
LTDRPTKILSLRYLNADPANRKAVDAAKEEIVRKICLPEKTAAGETKTEGAGKDSPEVARNKMIQRTLGVKVDGIITKSMAVRP